MRLIDADALMWVSLFEFWQDAGAITPIGENILGRFRKLVINAPTIEQEQMRLNDTGAQSAEYPHGLIVPLPMPIRGCCFCMFRDGNLCRFLPDDVEVVEAAKLEKRHELCPLVEV